MADEDNGMGVRRESSDSLQAGQKPRLLCQVRDVLRCKHYSELGVKPRIVNKDDYFLSETSFSIS